MNTNIQLHQIGMLLKQDLSYNKGKYISYAIGFTLLAILFIFLVFMAYTINMRYANGTNYHEGRFAHPENFLDIAIAQGNAINFIGSLFMCYLATRIFFNMQTKQQRIAYLMLPANNIAKFLARLISIVGLGIAIILAATIISDAIFCIYCFVHNPETCHSITIAYLNSLFTINTPADCSLLQKCVGCFLSWSFFIWCHSLFVLGGTLFRKHTTILCVGIAFVVWQILIFTTPKITGLGIFAILNNVILEHHWMLGVSLSVISLGLAFFCYRTSYKIFRRMQVINNKWLNL